MASNARNLANLLGTGQSTISAEKLGSDVPPGTEDYSSVDSLGVGTTIGETAFVEATNRLYIWNGSGWYNIALINTTPTWDSGGQPEVTYTLDADSPQDATVITLAASDPEGLPISYNYITSGSMDSIATISQDSSVFTITPKTSVQAPDGGTGSITFRATDGVNILPQVSSFTLNFISTITNSKYTTLLATATDTSDNNDITDASSNNHSITVNGDAYAGTFSPYRSGGYSTYFDGTGDNLDISASSDFDFGTGDFTFEMSFYAYVTSGGGKQLITNRASGWGAGVFQFLVSAAATNVYCTFYGYDLGGYTIVPETWYHISAVKSGDTITLYLNGGTPTAAGGYSQSHSGVNNVSMGSSSKAVDIGSNGTADYFKGYITDLRIVKGTAITPPAGGPTERLEAVTNTSLLTCHLPYISDGSTNDHTITVNGDPETKPFSPYDYDEYAATDHGGSVYFDRVSYNSGGYVTVADHNDFTLGTSDWTVKFWVYHNELDTTSGTAYGYFSNYYFNTPGGFGLKWMQQWGNKPVLEYMNSGSYAKKIFDFVPSAKIWYYYELTCSSSTVTFKVNGDTIGTQSMPDLGNPDRTLIVGAASNGSSGVENILGGYIADFQYVTGGTASESSVPISPMSTNTNSALHIKGTDASIIDKSQGTNLLIDGTTITGVSTGSKYSKAIKNTAASSAIKVCTPSEFNMRTNDDFTIEFWFKVDPTSSYSATNWPKYILQIQYGGIVFGIWANPSTTKIEGNGAKADGSGYITWSSSMFTSYTPNQWHHYALSFDKSNTTAKWFLDGSVYHTDTSYNDPSTSVTNSNSTYMVSLFGETGTVNSNTTFIGSIEDFRFSQFTRYTTNFTPPTASLEG